MTQTSKNRIKVLIPILICLIGMVGILVYGINHYRQLSFQQISNLCQTIIESHPEVEDEVLTSLKEYLEEVKMCLEEDNEISPRERRLLDRLRIKLNISEERAKELEESLKSPQLTKDEQEYLEEYKLCMEEDGEISSKERRLLDRLRDKLGISVERAKELENYYN